MASQEEQVEGPQAETTAAQDSAEFSRAWDEHEANESGQSAPAAERQEEAAEGEDQPEKEAGQGEAEAGQPAAGTTPEADADEASREKTSDDVWESADPKLREAHENELKAAGEKAKRAENLARSNGGRLAKALTELDALQKTLAQASGSGGEAATSEEIEAAKRDYPELVTPLLDKIDTLGKRIETLTTTATARAESEVAEALSGEFAALVERHPDTPAIVQAPEYAAWLQEQAPSIQRIVHENSQAVVSAADTALVFDKFKADTGYGQTDVEAAEAAKSAAQKRADQLEAGRSATGKQPGVRSDAKTGDGSYDDEWDRLDAADKRKSAGRR